jgi:cellulose synthase/poly-beta-1,6-N-acetylglucosamine synthase-like glycosyltransferase
MNKKTSVALCVSVNHTLPGQFLKHFMNFYLRNKDKYDLFPVVECHYVTEYARNQMINKLIKVSNVPDYFFFIDSDMIFAHDTLDKLIEADKDIITGLYFQKHKPHYPLLLKIRELSDLEHYTRKKYVWHTEYKLNEIEEIDACGAGALLVKSDVFKKVNSPWFDFKIDNIGCPVGEDIFFCRKLQNNGYKIYSHNGTMIDHIGNASISMRDFAMFKMQKEYEVEKETGLHPETFTTEDYKIL